ncbi:hypothetical protein QYE76_061685 [Lolium multiflorum]|uniref:Uncharacterized protein n=1 Tax=Lolium multiflorum TaxID=4521 RepID=A0AAD8W6J9_LOLMU|nr:hypothetical protein QYE76_061685 [Lolium multiflorum]
MTLRRARAGPIDSRRRHSIDSRRSRQRLPLRRSPPHRCSISPGPPSRLLSRRGVGTRNGGAWLSPRCAAAPRRGHGRRTRYPRRASPWRAGSLACLPAADGARRSSRPLRGRCRPAFPGLQVERRRDGSGRAGGSPLLPVEETAVERRGLFVAGGVWWLPLSQETFYRRRVGKKAREQRRGGKKAREAVACAHGDASRRPTPTRRLACPSVAIKAKMPPCVMRANNFRAR